MRINVYSQELTDEVHRIEKPSNTGVTYSAVQFILHSSDKLHHPPQDDDRSAVTFWLPKSVKRRERLAQAFEEAARLVRAARNWIGLTAPARRSRAAVRQALLPDDQGKEHAENERRIHHRSPGDRDLLLRHRHSDRLCHRQVSGLKERE